MRAFLLEVENTREHCPLGFIQLPMRVCVHHECPQFTRRVRGYFVLYGSGHPNSAANEVCEGVYDNHERSQNTGKQPHDRDGIFARQLRVLPGDRPRHKFAQYYMKEHRQSEPGRATHHAQADSGK